MSNYHQIIPETVRSYDKACIGCRRLDRAVMLAFLKKGDEFYDIFLTQEQAVALMQELGRAIKYNEEHKEP